MKIFFFIFLLQLAHMWPSQFKVGLRGLLIFPSQRGIHFLQHLYLLTHQLVMGTLKELLALYPWG